jgi:hypothetical protein
MSLAVITACTPAIFSAADAPVRHRAAQDHGIEQSVRLEVIDVFAAAAQEPEVFPPFDGAADERILHGRPSGFL